MQSAFGKGLTTILNEYVATRTKGELQDSVPITRLFLHWMLVFNYIMLILLNRVFSCGPCRHDLLVEEAGFYSQPDQVTSLELSLYSCSYFKFNHKYESLILSLYSSLLRSLQNTPGISACQRSTLIHASYSPSYRRSQSCYNAHILM